METENIGTAAFEVSWLLLDKSDNEPNMGNEFANERIFHWQLFLICITFLIKTQFLKGNLKSLIHYLHLKDFYILSP